jgi:ABC-type sugar transport systems, permease components
MGKINLNNPATHSTGKIVKHTRKKFLDNDNVVGYIFISPFVVGFLAFTIIPILASLYYSFTDFDLLSSPRFTGLANYIQMFTADQKFIKSLKVTFFFVFISVPLRLIFALFVAMLFTVKSKAVGIYRAVYYIPSIIGGSVAIAVLWKKLFGEDGVVNAILLIFGIDSKVSWLGNPNTAIWTLILLAVWQFGSSMLIFLAGLKQIPESYYEAAVIDGASFWQKFKRITIPMLTPVIFFNLIMQLINGFMSFTQSFIISNGSGSPLDSLLLYALYLYQKAFAFQQMGYGCAMAWVMLVIIGILTAIAFKSSSAWVYYESKED